MIKEYLQLLAGLTDVILEDNKNDGYYESKAMLSEIVEDFHKTVKSFGKSWIWK